MTPKKKLIEVALPLDAINKASAREKSIRHGHPSTLHLWWARRPLAAARAVIFSQMVDDPSAYVDVLRADPKLRRKAEAALKARLKLWQEARTLAEKAKEAGLPVPEPGPAPTLDDMLADQERQRLFRIIEDLMLWENTTNEKVLQAARDEIWQSWRRTCAENADHPRAKELFDRYKLPAFHDPFAGGGALPLEAQRLGLESFASDLNPVAVLINKAMIEIPPKFAGRPPVNPGHRKSLFSLGAPASSRPNSSEHKQWFSRGYLPHFDLPDLVQSVTFRLADSLPQTVLEKMTRELAARPESERQTERERRIAAYLDASHGACWLKDPRVAALVENALLHFDGQRYRLLAWCVMPNHVHALVETKVGYPLSEIVHSWKSFTANEANKILGREGDFWQREYHDRFIRDDDHYRNAVVYIENNPVKAGLVKTADAWRYSSAWSHEEKEAGKDAGAPSMWRGAQGLAEDVRYYGQWMRDEAEKRIGHLYPQIEITAEMAKERPDLKPYVGRKLTVIAWLWARTVKSPNPAFAHVDVPLASTFMLSTKEGKEAYVEVLLAEPLLAGSAGFQPARSQSRQDGGAPSEGLADGFTGAAAYAGAVGVYTGLGVGRSADFWCSIATWSPQPKNELVSHAFTKQAVPMTWDYAEVNPFSDSGGNFTQNLSFVAKCVEKFGFSPVFPDLFGTVAVPKAEELVATPYRHGGKEQAEAFFLDGMTQAMRRLAEQVHRGLPVTIYYAFKQAETESAGKGGGTTSTGWDTFLEAVIRAGFLITGTWPLRTEREARSRGIGSNALASSILLVCRPRTANAPTATRREFVTALKTELPKALALLQRGNIAPVDLAQAAIGPGMRVYTRFAKVVDAEGKLLPVREALALINHTLDEALAEQEGDFDADSRWALAWFEQYGFSEGEYGVAETLSKAKNTSVQGLKNAGILDKKSLGGKVRLLRPNELTADWDPSIDARLTAWEMVHHLIRVLEAGGESGASVLAAKLGTKAEIARELCYRLYTLCERKKRAVEALSYNGLVQSWPEITRLAHEGRTVAEQSNLPGTE